MPTHEHVVWLADDDLLRKVQIAKRPWSRENFSPVGWNSVAFEPPLNEQGLF
jgi:hypothetical protein